MKPNFRKELFMASRDRLKEGEESRSLRKYLADKLGSKNGRLKSFAKNITQNEDLLKLLDQTLNLGIKSKGIRTVIKIKIQTALPEKNREKSRQNLLISNDFPQSSNAGPTEIQNKRQ